MSLPAKCRRCGTEFFMEGLFGGTIAHFQISNFTTNCRVPGCGGIAEIQPGIYQVVNSVITAFTAPGLTREKVQKFKEIAEAVDAGEKDAHTAYLEVAELDDQLANAWDWTNENAGALGVIIAILSILLAHYYWKQSGVSAVEDRQVEERNAKALEKIGEELEKQRLSGALPAKSPRPTQGLLPQHLQQIATSAKPNRHERRKAKRIAERQKKHGE
jgi:hypothetical protein